MHVISKIGDVSRRSPSLKSVCKKLKLVRNFFNLLYILTNKVQFTIRMHKCPMENKYLGANKHHSLFLIPQHKNNLVNLTSETDGIPATALVAPASWHFFGIRKMILCRARTSSTQTIERRCCVCVCVRRRGERPGEMRCRNPAGRAAAVTHDVRRD